MAFLEKQLFFDSIGARAIAHLIGTYLANKKPWVWSSAPHKVTTVVNTYDTAVRGSEVQGHLLHMELEPTLGYLKETLSQDN